MSNCDINYFKTCHSLMNEFSKKNMQIMKLQVDNEELRKENKCLKRELNHLKYKYVRKLMEDKK